MITQDTNTYSATFVIHDDEIDALLTAIEGKDINSEILEELKYAQECIEDNKREQRERVNDMFGDILEDLEELCAV